MNRSEFSLPVDIALKIVSSLELTDVCSLGCCSRYWEDVCGYDYIWEFLSRGRWPDASLEKEFLAYKSQRDEVDQSTHHNTKQWRGFYMVKHQDMARKANLIAEYLEKESFSESIDVGDYMKATEDLQAMHFSFKDVELLLFKPKFNVLLNLVALHHCIVQLELPASLRPVEEAAWASWLL
ncbi:hypothetical protein M9H77_36679 [Catharanthus roseus]|uniref:Uncharacterized protein n=1 Tax=Catharanthus roseus TaxID=4058 RepID=A0ACB9ZSJ1_CATRO|nr:hypothetical protein M9H77_36679 [Catharanthus roseus]